MTVRVQVLLDEKELASIRARARREKLSMSAWIRAAATRALSESERRGFRTTGDLQAFFRECDRAERGREPDWNEHLATMQSSRRGRG
jgi:hypothetical protein